MKIGIIVYSQTGNTLSVAQRLKEKLAQSCHEAAVEQVMPSGSERQDVRRIHYTELPDVMKYDVLVFAAPVQGFQLAPAMASYLTYLPLLGGKKAACFVTKQLRPAWTGGNRALAQMKDVVEAKGGKVSGTGIVCWKIEQRDRDIEALMSKLGRLFN